VSGIFISYRRDDSAATVGRIYDRLVEAFGKEVVFKDVDSIPLGADFPQYIGGVIQRCAVALVVIGPQWAEARGEDGQPRLANPGDFVRLEAETALQRGIPVIPLLVQGAGIPKPEQLPPSMRGLVSRNATPIRYDPDFDNDMRRLINTLESEYQIPARGAFVAPALAGAAPERMVTLPQSSRRAGIVAAVVAVVVLLTCAGTAIFAGKQISQLLGSLPFASSFGGDQGPHTTLDGFCTALQKKDYSAAYAFLTTGFQQQVGDASNLPDVVGGKSLDIQEHAIDCSYFTPFTITNDRARGVGNVVVNDSAFDSHTIGRTFVMAKIGNTWKIDDIQGQ